MLGAHRHRFSLSREPHICRSRWCRFLAVRAHSAAGRRARDDTATAEGGVPLAFGVDIGATKWMVGTPAASEVTLLGHGATSDVPTHTLAAIRDVIAASRGDAAEPCRIVVAFAGATDEAGRVTGWPNRPTWLGYVLNQPLGSLRADIAIVDDGYAAALGQIPLVRSHGGTAFVLALGSGIGGALVYEGRPVCPKGRGACTIGHISALRSNRRCRCGSRGCLQTALETLPHATAGCDALAWDEGKELFDRLSEILAAIGVSHLIVCGGLAERPDVRAAVGGWCRANSLSCSFPAKPATSSLAGACLGAAA